MSVFGPKHIRNWIENFEEVKALCEGYKQSGARVCIVTENLTDDVKFETRVSLGRVRVVYHIFEGGEATVMLKMDGQVWIDGTPAGPYDEGRFVAFTTDQRSVHTTFYEETEEIRRVLVENEIKVQL